MRAGIGLILAVAAAAAGCRSLGLYEESAKDLSSMNTKAGGYLDLDAPHKVKVVRFEPDFKAAPGKVKVVLQNDGPPEDFLSFDLEFGYPAPAGSLAPYVPDYASIDVADWKAGAAFEQVYEGTAGNKSAPLFARILASKGAEVRMTAYREASNLGLRSGTSLVSGRVEVVSESGDLTPPAGVKPTLSFTIESMDEAKEVGNLKYMVQFYDKDGKLIDLGRRYSAFRPVGKPLGKKGDRVVVEVVGLDTITVSLAGARPVLRVIQ